MTVDQNAPADKRGSVQSGKRTRVHRGVPYEVSAAHPAADCWPWMSDDELHALADDIRATEQRLPILRLPDGRILDGRNRELACLIAGEVPTYETVSCGGADETAAALVASLNGHRRHLTPDERRECAARLRAAGYSLRRIADQIGVSQTTVQRDLSKQHSSETSGVTYVTPEPKAERVIAERNSNNCSGATYVAPEPKSERQPATRGKDGKVYRRVKKAAPPPADKPEVQSDETVAELKPGDVEHVARGREKHQASIDQLKRLIASLDIALRSRSGRGLRRLTVGGKEFFEQTVRVTEGKKTHEVRRWTHPALVALLDAMERSIPATTCAACRGVGDACAGCRGLGYAPRDWSVLGDRGEQSISDCSPDRAPWEAEDVPNGVSA